MRLGCQAARLGADYPSHKITVTQHGHKGLRFLVLRVRPDGPGPLVLITDSADEVREVLGSPAESAP